MPLRLDNAKGVAHMPTVEAAEENKNAKPRFKIDLAASTMPEIDSQNASRPGRHQIGMVGEIISESLGEIKSEYPGEIIGIRSSTGGISNRDILPSLCDVSSTRKATANQLMLASFSSLRQSDFSLLVWLPRANRARIKFLNLDPVTLSVGFMVRRVEEKTGRSHLKEWPPERS
jgi:hypothetical protein